MNGLCPLFAMAERMEWRVLGRLLGTCTGWDGDEEVFSLYDFEPGPDTDGLKACSCLNINQTTGAIEMWDSDNNQIGNADAYDALRNVVKSC